MDTVEHCPICNAPTETDSGQPGCGCANRAALREDVVPEAEDFHPLRVRPYVALPGDDASDVPAPLPTAPLPVVAETPGAAGVAGAVGAVGAVEVPGPVLLPDRPDRAEQPRPRRRRGPVVVAAAATATVVAVGAVVLAGQLLGGSDRADRAHPDNGTSAPDLVLPSGSGSGSGGPSPSSSRSGTASPSATAPASVTPSASRTTGAAAGTAASASATPSRSSTSASASASRRPSGSPSATTAPVLRQGDQGTEVVELQKRLGQVLLYTGADDGVYDSDVREAVSRYQSVYRVQGDSDGVYGTHTRASLESRTQEP